MSEPFILDTRSVAENQLYMDVHGCEPGVRGHRLESIGSDLVAVYTCQIPGEKEQRTFHFKVPEDLRRVDGFGDEPSRILGPGQLLLHAFAITPSRPANRFKLSDDRRRVGEYQAERAADIVGEVIKFVPDGREAVPRGAFRTAHGLRAHDDCPSRFTRSRLARIATLYECIAADHRWRPSPRFPINETRPTPVRPDKIPTLTDAQVERFFSLIKTGIEVHFPSPDPKLHLYESGKPGWSFWDFIGKNPTTWKSLRKEIARESRVRPGTWYRAWLRAERDELTRALEHRHWARARRAFPPQARGRLLYKRNKTVGEFSLLMASLPPPRVEVDAADLNRVICALQRDVAESLLANRKSISETVDQITGLYGWSREPNVGRAGTNVLRLLQRRLGNVRGIHAARAVFEDIAGDHDAALASLHLELELLDPPFADEVEAVLREKIAEVEAHREGTT